MGRRLSARFGAPSRKMRDHAVQAARPRSMTLRGRITAIAVRAAQ
jgi:hypothetical protein